MATTLKGAVSIPPAAHSPFPAVHSPATKPSAALGAPESLAVPVGPAKEVAFTPPAACSSFRRPPSIATTPAGASAGTAALLGKAAAPAAQGERPKGVVCT